MGDVLKFGGTVSPPKLVSSLTTSMALSKTASLPEPRCPHL